MPRHLEQPASRARRRGMRRARRPRWRGSPAQSRTRGRRRAAVTPRADLLDNAGAFGTQRASGAGYMPERQQHIAEVDSGGRTARAPRRPGTARLERPQRSAVQRTRLAPSRAARLRTPPRAALGAAAAASAAAPARTATLRGAAAGASSCATGRHTGTASRGIEVDAADQPARDARRRRLWRIPRARRAETGGRAPRPHRRQRRAPGHEGQRHRLGRRGQRLHEMQRRDERQRSSSLSSLPPADARTAPVQARQVDDATQAAARRRHFGEAAGARRGIRADRRFDALGDA